MSFSASANSTDAAATPWYLRRSPLAVPARRSDVDVQILDDQAVLYDAATGATIRLNETALAVWHACEPGRTLQDIAEELAQTYDVTYDQALDDVEQVVVLLAEQGLLSPNG